MITSEILKKMRNSAGLTQVELSNKMGVSQAMITQYETGKIICGMNVGRKWAKECGYTMEINFRKNI